MYSCDVVTKKYPLSIFIFLLSFLYILLCICCLSSLSLLYIKTRNLYLIFRNIIFRGRSTEIRRGVVFHSANISA